MSVLRCGVPGCGAPIYGMTGFMEAQNLLKHLNRVHAEPGRRYDLNDALELRVKFEALMEAPEEK